MTIQLFVFLSVCMVLLIALSAILALGAVKEKLWGAVLFFGSLVIMFGAGYLLVVVEFYRSQS